MRVEHQVVPVATGDWALLRLSIEGLRMRSITS